MTFFKAFAFGALALGSTLAGLNMAHADERVGVLECDISGGVGLIVTSEKTLSCVFKPERGKPEYYAGAIRRVGLDIGFTGPGRLSWVVLSAAPRPVRYALAGDYAGAGAGVTVGAGLGANGLVGGNGRSISLQPLSISVQTGLDVNAGIGALTLQPVPPVRSSRH
jgi:hypothetical protein